MNKVCPILLVCGCLCAETTENVLDFCFERAEEMQHQIIYCSNKVETAYLHGKIKAFDEVIYFIQKERSEENDR